MNTSHGVLVTLLGVLLFLGPPVLWLAGAAPAWWWPFAIWAGFVGVVALATGRRRDP